MNTTDHKTSPDPFDHLLTFSEIDTAVATLQKIATVRERELQDDGRRDAAGNLAANLPVYAVIEQLQLARQFRAIPDELMQSWRKIRHLDAEEQ